MVDAPAEHHTPALPNEDCGQKLPRFKGIRLRKWGSWGSEIRTPKTRAKIWLGSYKSAEQAARAYDAALYCLRGPNAKFNFPDSVPSIPSAFSFSPRQIQVAAARYARDELPTVSPSSHSNDNNKATDREEASLASPSRSSLASETELRGDSEQISEKQGFWESLFDRSGCLNFQDFPLIDDTSALEFIPSWQEEEEAAADGYISLDLWNFRRELDK